LSPASALNANKFAITGLILAGGRGLRMSTDGHGIDKGLVQVASQPMVQHVLDRLAPQVDHLLINANQNTEQYTTIARAYGAQVINDSISGYAGPLAGCHAGLLHLKAQGQPPERATTEPLLLTCPCDSPGLPNDLVARLLAPIANEGAELSVAVSGGQAQPVFMLMRASVIESLNAFMASGQRKIDKWYPALRYQEVHFDDAKAFRNINTPEELAAYSLTLRSKL
jgi:molybdenum cofactor guanylyltransferase